MLCIGCKMVTVLVICFWRKNILNLFFICSYRTVQTKNNIKETVKLFLSKYKIGCVLYPLLIVFQLHIVPYKNRN